MSDPNADRPGYKETRVGWIPEEWAVKPLARLTKPGKPIVYGIVQAGPDTPGGIPYIRTTDVGPRMVSSEGLLRTTPEIAASYRRSAVETGDLAFALRGDIGAVSMVPQELDGANLSRGAARIAVDSAVYPDYVRYALGGGVVRKLIDSWRNGSTFREITIEDLRKLPVPVPKAEESHRIAEILSMCDVAIEKTGELIKIKERQKQTLMQQLLTRKRRLPGFEGAWEHRRLGELFNERAEIDAGHLPLLAITGTRGIIPASEIDRKDSSSDDKTHYKVIKPGDIGYNTMRMWQGVSAVSALEGIVSPAYTICVPLSETDVDFMGYYFKFPPNVHLFWRYSQGLVDDTLSLKFPNFAAIPVEVPARDEQAAIARVLRSADEEIAVLKRRLSALELQKKSLMQKLLTGQVRVKV